MLGFRSVAVALFAFQSAPPPAAPPPGVIARVDGVDLPLADFRDWVVAAHGWRHVDDYVDLALLRKEATRLGLALPTAADLDAAFEQDWQDQILMRHSGDEAKWQDELAKSGLDRDGYRDRRAGTLELEVVAKRILQKTPMTAEQRRELWEKEFNQEGVQTHVRVAFFSTLGEVHPGERVSAAEMAGFTARAKERADAFLAAVRAAPARFAELVTSGSDRCTIPRYDSYPIDVRAHGGTIERLRSDHFGGALLQAIVDGSVKDGDCVGPVTTSLGLVVAQVVARTPRPFEGAEAELDRIWSERPPSAGEIYHLRQKLRTNAKIERYPLHR
jgi:hypothetical protein